MDVCCLEWGINRNDGRQVMKLIKFALNTAIIIIGVLSFQVASACSFEAWFTSSGTVIAEDPAAPTQVSRLSGFCGMEAAGTGFVEDRSPVDDESFIARFYFLPELTQTQAGVPVPADIFVAYSDDGATTELFSINFDGANINVDATAAPGGGTASAAADTTHWNLIEIAWESGVGGSLWVNADAAIPDAASDTFTPGTGSVNSVRFGFPNGFGTLTGMGTFDDYQSQRTLPVGGLLICDANGDESLGIADAISLFNELGGTLNFGQPDCNIDGDIGIADVIRLFNTL